MFRSSWLDLSEKNMLKLLNLEHFLFDEVIQPHREML